MSKLEEKLAALITMSSAQLRAEWRQVWKAPAPPLAHDLLRRGITYRLQERAQAGLARSVYRELDRLAKQMERGGDLSFERAAKPGTRLVRQWQGKTYHVLILEDGYIFEDRRYTSLTQIAQAITGTHWSGPRFFGLRRHSDAKSIRGSEGRLGTL